MEIAVVWFALCIAAAVYAVRCGRSGIVWFFISLFLSPLVGFLFLLVLPKTGVAAAPKDELGNPITPKTHVRCPDCREVVRRDANKCKHCGTALVPQ